MPYREKEQGNSFARQQDYDEAIKHYELALNSMRSLFDGFGEGMEDALIADHETALRYIMEIEIPVCLNLGLCYLRLGKNHEAIYYCTQALDKDQEQNEKALYRRGVAYLNIGELNKARADLTTAD